MIQLIEFLDELENRKIYYCLNKIRDTGTTMGSGIFCRWKLEVEKFISNGTLYNES